MPHWISEQLSDMDQDESTWMKICVAVLWWISLIQLVISASPTLFSTALRNLVVIEVSLVQHEILNMKSDECRLAQHQAGTQGKPSNGYGEIATVNYTVTA